MSTEGHTMLSLCMHSIELYAKSWARNFVHPQRNAINCKLFSTVKMKQSNWYSVNVNICSDIFFSSQVKKQNKAFSEHMSHTHKNSDSVRKEHFTPNFKRWSNGNYCRSSQSKPASLERCQAWWIPFGCSLSKTGTSWVSLTEKSSRTKSEIQV